MYEPVACIFPHSDDEFSNLDALVNFLRHDLPGERNGEYWLRKIGWKDKDFKARVIPGSLVLFFKKRWVVGQATIQNAIEKLEPPEPRKTEPGEPVTYYQHKIFFEPTSVRIFEEALSVERLEAWCGRRLFPGLYAILGTRQAYEQAFSFH